MSRIREVSSGMTTCNGYLIPRRQAYSIILMLFLLHMFDQAERHVITPLFPLLKSQWGITDTQFGPPVAAVYRSQLIFTLPTSLLIPFS